MAGDQAGATVFSRGFTLLLAAIVAVGAALEAASVINGVNVPLWVDLGLALGVAAVAWARARAGLPPGLAVAPALLPPALLVEAVLPGSTPPYMAYVVAAVVGGARLALALDSLALMPRYSVGLGIGADVTLVQLAITASIVVVLGATGVYIVERGVGSINSFWDALWWAMATATTVGYGDVVPVTPAGRAIAVALMVFGIGFLGVFLSDMAVRVARAISRDDVDSLPLLEREKRALASAVMDLEKLDDEEFEILVNKLRTLHLLLRAEERMRITAAKAMVAGAKVVLEGGGARRR